MLHHRCITLLFTAVAVMGMSSTSCHKKGSGAVVPDPFLRDVAPFPVGVSVGYKDLTGNVPYQTVVREEMSSVSVENAQKWAGLHPEKDRFDFTQADYIVDWVRKNGQRVHGHNLLWHSYNPGWVNAFQGDSAAWESLIKTHIQTVVQHFKGRVVSCDVVNEAFTDAGQLRNVEKNAKDGSIWRQHLGPDYIAHAFQYARAADPNVLLFYNDYGQESKPAKTKAITDMVTDFKKRGIPIDGLGLQMHIGVSQSNDGIRNAIQQSAETGWITKQGYTDWSLLFDKNYQRKKTYYAFADGLKN